MEPILPLITVSNDRELEWRAIKKDKLNVADCVNVLDLVAQLNVLSDCLIKVGYSRVLGTVTTHESILLNSPDNLEPLGGNTEHRY